MDAKGEDSGSDTLDQSLQKKCVVADDDSSKQPDAAVREDNAADEPTTEPGGDMSDSKDSPASPSPPPPTQHLTSTDNNIADTDLVVVKDKEDLLDENTCSSEKDDSRGFESKVRQISNDLKETTLADENSSEKVDDLDVSKQDDPTAAIEPSTAGAAAPTLEDVKNESDAYDSDRTITYESPSKKSSSSPSEKKKSKKITKKVRFKSNQNKDRSDDEGDDGEGDEDDDDEDEDEDDDDDEEDTLNESNRCKKIRISLSFVSPHDEDDDNLSDEAGAQSLADDTEVEEPTPEGGVENILGKLCQKGKIEYLFRWVDKPGIQWESEEVLSKMCPNLIKRYEAQRAKEREQDMQYVMRRKKVRQDLRNF